MSECHLGTPFSSFDVLSLYLFRWLKKDGGYTLRRSECDDRSFFISLVGRNRLVVSRRSSSSKVFPRFWTPFKERAVDGRNSARSFIRTFKVEYPKSSFSVTCNDKLLVSQLFRAVVIRYLYNWVFIYVIPWNTSESDVLVKDGLKVT